MSPEGIEKCLADAERWAREARESERDAPDLTARSFWTARAEAFEKSAADWRTKLAAAREKQGQIREIGDELRALKSEGAVSPLKGNRT